MSLLVTVGAVVTRLHLENLQRQGAQACTGLQHGLRLG
jgi:hypothetical protein